jgi:hypothetical protein
VAAVLDDDVDRAGALAQTAQEVAVLLVADDDIDAVLGERRAARVDVDADDAGLAAEVVLPHLQRAAVVDAELDDGDRLAAVRREVAVVNVEVVQPLVDQAAAVGPEVRLERVGLRLRLRHARRLRQPPSCKPTDRYERFPARTGP